MTVNVLNFLIDRKEQWLKDKLKKAKDETECLDLIQQANLKFSLEQWLPDAAKRGCQLSMVSHPSKFSHPSAKTSNILVSAQLKNDGYLRSGNIDYQLDVFGNAAAMDVYKFLIILLSNGKTVLENLEQDSDIIKSLLFGLSIDYEELKTKFLSIKAIDPQIKTDRLVKQVYFPTGVFEYHLLSILTPSGLLTEVKQRIDNLRFSENTKQAKEDKRKNNYNANGFADIYDLTIMAYGGTKPQNISALNNQNGGKTYLLPSIPPALEKRNVKLPRFDFFKQCLYRKNFQESFKNLHKLMQLEINNVNIRNAINKIISFIIDDVLFTAFKIRQYESGWSIDGAYSNLPLAQRIWLDDAYQEKRLEQNEWRDEVSQSIARWVLRTYKDLIQGAFLLGDVELQKINQLVAEVIEQDKEFFNA